MSKFFKIAQADSLAEMNKGIANISNLRKQMGDFTNSGGPGIVTKGWNFGNTGTDAVLKSIAKNESGFNFGAINKDSGTLGAFQFKPSTLRGLGYTGTNEAFLNDPNMQMDYARKYLAQGFGKAGYKDINAINWDDNLVSQAGNLWYTGRLNPSQGLMDKSFGIYPTPRSYGSKTVKTWRGFIGG